MHGDLHLKKYFILFIPLGECDPQSDEFYVLEICCIYVYHQICQSQNKIKVELLSSAFIVFCLDKNPRT